MPIISYSQNLEDVILHRVLSHVRRGFYIDVGAQDPREHSVTLAFYELGWQGINIEPSNDYFKMLENERPRDVNLNIAVSDHEGEVEFYEFPNTGLSTTVSEFAEGHVVGGFESRVTTKPCKTLDTVCKECDVKEVHFLKIDAEGGEHSILKGFSFDTVRPWILVIESLEPNTPGPYSDSHSTKSPPKSNHDTWENMVLNKSYIFAYFDGLNRYYVASEKKELLSDFASPPNIFDGYRLSSQVDADNLATRYRLHIQHLEDQNTKLERYNTDLERYNTDLERYNTDLERYNTDLESNNDRLENSITIISNRLDMVLHSHSWRLTAPLRTITDMVKPLLSKLSKNVKLLGKLGSIKARIAINSFLKLLWRLPLIQQLGRRIFNHSPHLKAWVVRLAKVEDQTARDLNGNERLLTERAWSIYERIKKLSKQRTK